MLPCLPAGGDKLSMTPIIFQPDKFAKGQLIIRIWDEKSKLGLPGQILSSSGPGTPRHSIYLISVFEKSPTRPCEKASIPSACGRRGRHVCPNPEKPDEFHAFSERSRTAGDCS